LQPPGSFCKANRRDVVRTRRATHDILSREVGLSRPAFAERFNAYVGSPPIEYLARWRMQLAAKLLDEGVDIAEAAGKVGYASPEAFNRVFKRFVGTAPGAWRRANRNKTTVSPNETTTPLIASSNPATRLETVSDSVESETPARPRGSLPFERVPQIDIGDPEPYRSDVRQRKLDQRAGEKRKPVL